MSRGVNKVILLGRIGQEPEVRYTNTGSAVTTISVATSEQWKDKQGQPQTRTEWHRVIFFGKLAEIAGQYLKKGSQVYVEGSIRTNKYTDKQGIERYSTEIHASEMQMIGGKGEQSQQPQQSYQPSQNSGFDQRNSQEKTQSGDDIDDLIPF